MSQQQLAPVPSPLLPSPRLPPELLGRIAYFVSLPSEDLFDHEQDWISAHETLCTLALVNRTFAAFARPLAWRILIWNDDTEARGLAHLCRTKTVQPFVHEMAWCFSYASTVSLPTFPSLSALTSFALFPGNRDFYEIPSSITKIMGGMSNLRRLETHYCDGWEDETFSVGRALPSLRNLIAHHSWLKDDLVEQELGSIEFLGCAVMFWGELVLRSSSTRVASLSTLRELHLSEAYPDQDKVLSHCAQTVARHFSSSPAPPPPPISLEVLTFSLTHLFEDPGPVINLISALKTAPSLYKLAFKQRYAVRAPSPEAWARLKLPQVRDLSLAVPKLAEDDEGVDPNAPLPFSAILSSFPQLESLTLVDIFSLCNAKFFLDPVVVILLLRDTPLEQLLAFIRAETIIQRVELREEGGKRFVRYRRDSTAMGGFTRELWHTEL